MRKPSIDQTHGIHGIHNGKVDPVRRYERILVACLLDGRDETVLRHVGRIAGAARSKEVVLVHVIEKPDLPEEDLEGLWESGREAASSALEQLASSHAGLFPEGTILESVVLEGDFVLELSRLATETVVDLIATAASGKDDLSTSKEAALRLLRKVPCSMLIVPEGAAPEYRRIVVPLDFSTASRASLDVALAVAGMSSESTVTGLHVYSAPVGYRKTGQTYDEAAEKMRELAEERWARIQEQFGPEGAPVDMRFQRDTGVATAILDHAEQNGSDLIVMSSHGRTKPAALLLGRTPESVFVRTGRTFLCVKKRGEVIGLLEALLRFLSVKNPH